MVGSKPTARGRSIAQNSQLCDLLYTAPLAVSAECLPRAAAGAAGSQQSFHCVLFLYTVTCLCFFLRYLV